MQTFQALFFSKRFKILGFTLLEVLIILGVIAISLFIATEGYNVSRQKANVKQAITDIRDMEIAIENYYMENGYKYPPDLAAIGMDKHLDPWGNEYHYLNIDALPEKGDSPSARKDTNLFPLNSDFDLYSMGADGKTKISLTDAESKDDVIRANNGSFIGLGSEY